MKTKPTSPTPTGRWRASLEVRMIQTVGYAHTHFMWLILWILVNRCPVLPSCQLQYDSKIFGTKTEIFGSLLTVVQDFLVQQQLPHNATLLLVAQLHFCRTLLAKRVLFGAGPGVVPPALRAAIAGELSAEREASWVAWLGQWRQQLQRQNLSDEDRKRMQNGVNPMYIPRQHLLQVEHKSFDRLYDSLS